MHKQNGNGKQLAIGRSGDKLFKYWVQPQVLNNVDLVIWKWAAHERTVWRCGFETLFSILGFVKNKDILRYTFQEYIKILFDGLRLKSALIRDNRPRLWTWRIKLRESISKLIAYGRRIYQRKENGEKFKRR